MKKLTITSVLALAIACPAFATVDIAADANSAGCNNTVLHTYSGPTSLEADWTANTITLDWYNGNTKVSTNSCTYDGAITLPENDPTKTGYTFAGWQVRGSAAAPQQTSFDLSTLNASTNGISYAYHSLSYYNEEEGFDEENCYYWSSSNGTSSDCEDSRLSSLSAGQWETGFSYGTIRGIAKCEPIEPYEYCWENSETGEEECEYYDNPASCYCQVTGFAEQNSSNYTPVASLLWVHWSRNGDANFCAGNCAANCTSEAKSNSSFRSRLYGISQ